MTKQNIPDSILSCRDLYIIPFAGFILVISNQDYGWHWWSQICFIFSPIWESFCAIFTHVFQIFWNQLLVEDVWSNLNCNPNQETPLSSAMDDRRWLLAVALGFGSAALLLTVARRARRRDGDAAAAETVETAEATWMPEATLVAVLSGLERWGWREERGGGGVYVHIWFYNYIYVCIIFTVYIILYLLINEHAKFKKIELTAVSPQINSSSVSFSLWRIWSIWDLILFIHGWFRWYHHMWWGW